MSWTLHIALTLVARAYVVHFTEVTLWSWFEIGVYVLNWKHFNNKMCYIEFTLYLLIHVHTYMYTYNTYIFWNLQSDLFSFYLSVSSFAVPDLADSHYSFMLQNSQVLGFRSNANGWYNGRWQHTSTVSEQFVLSFTCPLSDSVTPSFSWADVCILLWWISC